MCGNLVPYCRCCGHDTVYAGDLALEASPPDEDEAQPTHEREAETALLERARSDERTVVTRDRDLARRAEDSLLLECRDTDSQLEALRRAGVDLRPVSEPLHCGRCNGSLEAVPPDSETPAYAPETDEFDLWVCLECGQHFWKGSHWDRMGRRLEWIRASVGTGDQ